MNQGINKTKRNGNIEILRSICMLLVVISHYIYHGIKGHNIDWLTSSNNVINIINYLSMEMLWIISTVAVNCYIMISGYFLINKTEHRWKGIIKIWSETVLYSLAIYLMSNYISHQNIEWSLLSKEIFIIYFKQYWFINFYIALMLLAPYISIMTQHISKKQYQSLLIIMLILCFEIPYGKIFGSFASLPWFTLLYLTGGYIRNYSLPQFFKINALAFSILSTACFAILVLGYNILICKENFSELSLRSTTYNGPIYFLSILFFLIFITKFTFQNWLSKILLWAAPYTLGCYLIHDNHIIRSVLWDYVFEKNYFIPCYNIIQCITTCIVIFLVCTTIDCLREKLFSISHLNLLNEKISIFLSKKCL